MRKELFFVLLIAGSAFATQNTSITVREVRNPNTLKTWLEANAADAESRLVSGSTTNSILPLINFNNGGTCAVTMQADKGDDAGDKTAIVGSDGSGILFQSDITSKGTLATKASIGTDGIINTLVGLDGIGAVGLAFGSADVTAHTFISDGGTIVLDGTADIPGVITAGSDLTVAGDFSVASNATVGATLGVTGVATFTAESVHNAGIDADYITTDAGAGIDAKSAGALKVGVATATSVDISKSGSATTVAGTLTAVEGLTVTEDVTITLNASDEEITIAQTSTAGTANVPLISINDDRTGATADTPGEATLWIDAEGVYAIGIIDGAVAIESVLDTYAAGTLALGGTTATKITLAKTKVETEVVGLLDVLEDATLKGDVTITSNLVVGVAVDAASYTCDAAAGLDVQSAGTLKLGAATATKVEVSKTAVETEVKGTLDVLEDATFKGDVTLSSNLTVTAEVKIDGKYAIVGKDATTAIMVQSALVDAPDSVLSTNTYAVAFAAGSNPFVQLTYAEDPGDVQPIYVLSSTNTGFVAGITATKDFFYTAVGPRP